jgi:hypothetical protein
MRRCPALGGQQYLDKGVAIVETNVGRDACSRCAGSAVPVAAARQLQAVFQRLVFAVARDLTANP